MHFLFILKLFSGVLREERNGRYTYCTEYIYSLYLDGIGALKQRSWASRSTCQALRLLSQLQHRSPGSSGSWGGTILADQPLRVKEVKTKIEVGT